MWVSHPTCLLHQWCRGLFQPSQVGGIAHLAAGETGLPSTPSCSPWASSPHHGCVPATLLGFGALLFGHWITFKRQLISQPGPLAQFERDAQGLRKEPGFSRDPRVWLCGATCWGRRLFTGPQPCQQPPEWLWKVSPALKCSCPISPAPTAQTLLLTTGDPEVLVGC